MSYSVRLVLTTRVCMFSIGVEINEKLKGNTQSSSRLLLIVQCVKADRHAVVAEWLRRLTRNQFPSGSVGSNPTDCEHFCASKASLVQW